MITLAWPLALLALPLPLLAIWLPRAPDEQGAALRFHLDPDLAAEVARGTRSTGSLNPRLILALVAWVLLVLAAARPEWVGEPVRLPVSGRDLMIALDISGSMEVADYELNNRMVSRIALVKAVAERFIARREQDRLGLILFGSRAYLMTPLTFDRTTVGTMLSEAVVGLAGRETAVGDALALAVKHLRDQPEDNRVVILMTDGANNAGHIEPLAAAELAAQAGVRVYTIGIGGGMAQSRSPFGGIPARAGSDFDPATLQRIAEMTGGRFFSAHAREQLEEIYAELDRLEPSERDERSLTPRRSLYMWPAAGALLLSLSLAAAPLLSAGARRRVA
ncbi:MAG: VWA domain-containing protein [Thiocapsa sp.]|uniref:VWA domain-containing protein n=1 Tax=Thiocapsa sp. TaxID=2024551 RepID=UPI001BCCCC4D|nr:VWA domain-containing protein [Thiocapsa sp.]QVL51035.1 MAG: VWA domain-containing protein [Thiocapsa sp.]